MYASLFAITPVPERDLAACAGRFSPRIQITSRHTVLFDVSGTGLLFGNGPELLSRIEAEAGRRGLHVRVAISANPDTAIVAAHGCPESTLVPPGNESAFLSNLPVKVLLAANTAVEKERVLEVIETLQTWGIRTLGAFAALPQPGVSERLGPEGVYLQKIAQGRGTRNLVPFVPQLSFHESAELDYPVALLEPLLFILARLLKTLCDRLSQQNLAAAAIRIILSLENRSVCEYPIRLAIPVRDPRLLLKLAEVELEARRPDSPIVSVAVSAEHAKPRLAQNGLFAPAAPEPLKLEMQLARIAKWVGKENVGSPEVLDTHRPQSFRIKPFDFGAPNRTRSGRTRALSLRVFRPPLQASVQTNRDCPERISAPADRRRPGVRGKVAAASGPWRNSGDWWTECPWAREEWDVELEDGTICLVYRDAVSGAWFIEGTYD